MFHKFIIFESILALLNADLLGVNGDVSFCRYVRAGGEIAVQKNLSRERPGYRALHVNAVAEMLQVVCRNGVVWGLTSDRNLVVRVGITSTTEVGTEWAFLQGLEDIFQACILLFAVIF